MTLMHPLIVLAAFIALAALFIATTRQTPVWGKWLGLAVIAISAPFFFWLGAFSERFEAGQCYSNAFGMIGNSVAKTSAPADLAEQIRALPFYGYETICPDVEAAAKKLPNAGAQ